MQWSYVAYTKDRPFFVLLHKLQIPLVMGYHLGKFFEIVKRFNL